MNHTCDMINYSGLLHPEIFIENINISHSKAVRLLIITSTYYLNYDSKVHIVMNAVFT